MKKSNKIRGNSLDFNMWKNRPLVVVFIVLITTAILLTINWTMKFYRSQQVAGKLIINDPSLKTGLHSYQAGEFQIQLFSIGTESHFGPLSSRIAISHKNAPGKWLWHTKRGEAFVNAASGIEKVSENRGYYFIKDNIRRLCTDQTIDNILTSADTVIITGQVNCDKEGSVPYTLSFYPASNFQLTFHLEFQDASINRVYLNYASDSDEHFFGFGEQFTYFNLKGHIVPIWVSEQGIGRGRQPLTFLVDRVAQAGGTPFTTYAVVPHYITSRMRSIFLENTSYTEFDLRKPDRVQVRTFSPTLSGRILFGENPEALITEYTSWAGRMRPLPDWILNGAVLGLQGGTEHVREVYKIIKESGAPISALWLQDWVGQRITSFGKQLWWNWELDEERYPDWANLRTEMEKDGVKLMVYTNPYLVDVSQKPGAKNKYFQVAAKNGYLVKKPSGEPYLIQNTDFSAGLIDLTNEKAIDWYKNILKEALIEEAGASGWMADFGEALPYDAVLTSGESAKEFHNLYPEAWAKLNRELVDSLKNGDELVFFQRAAFQRSPSFSTLFWEGDQLVSWDQYDGIKSAVTGLLSGGISGLSLNHSDIGGYTTINNPVVRILRTQELLVRWMELSSMSVIFRSHEGNLPELNSQIYSNNETLIAFSRMAKVYQAWKPLRIKLLKEASENGIPIARHLFIHYPDDANVYKLSYQEYLLGSDLLYAPVLDPGKNSVRVYLPVGDWVHLWSGKIFRNPYEGTWIIISAPVGEPAIFYREGSSDGLEFKMNLMKAGIIN